jgi:hypothetical protein
VFRFALDPTSISLGYFIFQKKPLRNPGDPPSNPVSYAYPKMESLSSCDGTSTMHVGVADAFQRNVVLGVEPVFGQ